MRQTKVRQKLDQKRQTMEIEKSQKKQTKVRRKFRQKIDKEIDKSQTKRQTRMLYKKDRQEDREKLEKVRRKLDKIFVDFCFCLDKVRQKLDKRQTKGKIDKSWTKAYLLSNFCQLDKPFVLTSV